jgi:hypothetical protein
LAEVAAVDAEQEDSPRWAKNQTQLSVILEVSRKTIQRYAKHENAPKAKSDGRLDVEAWREFLAASGVLEDDDLDLVELKKRKITLENEKLEFNLQVAKEQFVPTVDVEKDVASLVSTAKAVLLSGPSSLAPQVVGVSIPEAETILREWLHDALSKLCANPLGKPEPEPTQPAQETEVSNVP